MVDPLVIDLVGTAQGTERQHIHLVARAAVDQAAVLAGERHVLQIVLHKILADFRADGFKEVAEMNQYRIVAPQCTAVLQDIQRADDDHRRKQRRAPVPGGPLEGKHHRHWKQNNGQQVHQVAMHENSQKMNGGSLQPRVDEMGCTVDFMA